MELSARLLAALRECHEWHGHQPYTWKQASMKKLEELGLAQPEQLMCAGNVAYELTDAGRRYLSASYSQEQK